MTTPAPHPHPRLLAARTVGVPGRPGTPPPTHTATGSDSTYTVTAYLNAASDHFNGYHPGHTAAQATYPDGTPLRLTFTTGKASSIEQAAHAAFLVGNRHTGDDHGHIWPADIRSLSVGDVLRITAPDHTPHHRAITPSGFTPTAPPTEHIHLAATDATSRRAFAWRPDDLAIAGALIGHLTADPEAPYLDHPSGTGATTTLCLHLPDGHLLIQPGQWLIHATGGHWQAVDAHAFANGHPT
ncbi:hypothetical protein [Streptomyces sp. NPDC058861]|uniref:hypothetical protein n=1 Tax=Streptomyces sp. NPDC058861 TaxID=3346653 RepID=UPI0036A05C68